MLLRFNTPMKPRNISLYNSSFIDIYMAPSNDWHLIEPGLDKLNLTWRVTEFKEDYMIFKLKFENELAISSKPMRRSSVSSLRMRVRANPRSW